MKFFLRSRQNYIFLLSDGLQKGWYQSEGDAAPQPQNISTCCGRRSSPHAALRRRTAARIFRIRRSSPQIFRRFRRSPQIFSNYHLFQLIFSIFSLIVISFPEETRSECIAYDFCYNCSIFAHKVSIEDIRNFLMRFFKIFHKFF